MTCVIRLGIQLHEIRDVYLAGIKISVGARNTSQKLYLSVSGGYEHQLKDPSTWTNTIKGGGGMTLKDKCTLKHYNLGIYILWYIFLHSQKEKLK